MLGAVYDKELALMTFMEVIKIVSKQLSFFRCYCVYLCSSGGLLKCAFQLELIDDVYLMHFT